jgi:hypothetical protein
LTWTISRTNFVPTLAVSEEGPYGEVGAISRFVSDMPREPPDLKNESANSNFNLKSNLKFNFSLKSSLNFNFRA